MPIRAATRADVAALVDLERSAFGADAWSETAVLEEVEGPHRTVVVLDVEPGDADTALDGWASVHLPADVADLARIAVRPLRRREGLGRRLLDSAAQTAREHGAHRMLLEVSDDNHAALRLYEQHGFRPISRRRGYYADGSDALVMERQL